MKNAPPPEALARVVRWIILLFIAYALLTGTFHLPLHDKPPSPPVAGSVAVRETQAAKDCSSESGLTNFSMMAAALLPSKVPTIHTQDLTQGKGQAAICGQTATLRFEYALENGTVLYSNFNGESSEATLGSGKLLKGLEQGILGMKPGGVRKISFSPTLGFGAVQNPASLLGGDMLGEKAKSLRDSVIVGKVSLVALSPALPASALQLRVIDHRFGGGVGAHCGDRVEIDTTLWKLDGSKVFSTQDAGRPLTFTIGLSQVPFGIEQAVLDMTKGGERTLILPPAYLKPLVQSDDASAAQSPMGPVPEETILAEIHLNHIGNDIKIPVTQDKKPAVPDKKSSSTSKNTEQPDDNDDDSKQ